MPPHKTDYNKLILDYLIYQGHSSIAQLYAKETNQDCPPDPFLLLRSQVRDMICAGDPMAAKKALELANFEFITTTSLADHLVRQNAIEMIARKDHEGALRELRECGLELSDVLEMIVYGRGIDVERWRTVCVEVVNQVVVDGFGEIRNALVELIGEVDWEEAKVSTYYDMDDV